MSNVESIRKFKELINSSNNILIASHFSPDPDSICSTLLLGTTLKKNFPKKQIIMLAEEPLEELGFLEGYINIKIQPLIEAVKAADFVIMVDSMNFARCTRHDGHKISELVQKKALPTAIIDHHQPVDIEPGAIYINREFPAAIEEVYEVCFKDLKLKKPSGWAETTMYGLYSDTAGFTYLNSNYKKTLQLLEELLDGGLKLEVIKNQLNHYSVEDIVSINHVLKNVKTEANYNYSYLRDDFVEEWRRSGRQFKDVLMGVKFFCDNFLRSLEGNHWGFIVYKDILSGDNVYAVSFRSLDGSPDVSELARKFGGGGHKGAAGAKLPAQSLDEALLIVKRIIEQSD